MNKIIILLGMLFLTTSVYAEEFYAEVYFMNATYLVAIDSQDIHGTYYFDSKNSDYMFYFWLYSDYLFTKTNLEYVSVNECYSISEFHSVNCKYNDYEWFCSCNDKLKSEVPRR